MSKQGIKESSVVSRQGIKESSVVSQQGIKESSVVSQQVIKDKTCFACDFQYRDNRELADHVIEANDQAHQRAVEWAKRYRAGSDTCASTDTGVATQLVGNRRRAGLFVGRKGKRRHDPQAPQARVAPSETWWTAFGYAERYYRGLAAGTGRPRR